MEKKRDIRICHVTHAVMPLCKLS